MYHDATIGNDINVVLVRIIYLEQEEVRLRVLVTDWPTAALRVFLTIHRFYFFTRYIFNLRLEMLQKHVINAPVSFANSMMHWDNIRVLFQTSYL